MTERLAARDTAVGDTATVGPPIDWTLAENVAVRVARRAQAVPPIHQPTTAQMGELVAQAEQLVGDHTGLRPPTPATAEVISREEWVRVNLAVFRDVLTPLWERWARDRPDTFRTSTRLGAKVAATQMGTLLGWMSGRVLGQYDVLVARDNGERSGDTVYLVGPNVALLERRYAFGTGQFRLWIALHEVTHRAQFRGVPWMQTHYRDLVDGALQMADPAGVMGALRAALTDRTSARDALRDGGAMALLATPDQRVALGRIAGLMSLLEGHGDVTMDRAGAHLLPDAARFGHVLRTRRADGSPLTKLVQRVIGLEAKLDQYRAGEQFIAAIEAAAGPSIIDRCWAHPDALPTLDEIRAPHLWLARTTP